MEKAVQIYENLSSHGHSDAIIQLGIISYLKGNKDDALQKFQRARNLGNPRSLFLIGVINPNKYI